MSLLQDYDVAWVSIDVVRIGYVDGTFHPVVVWIGVEPESLSANDGTLVAFRCFRILGEFGIEGVEVELRESCTTLLGGSKLLPPVPADDSSALVREPATHAVSLPISCGATPHLEGTGGLFVGEGGTNKRIFLLTARHVVFPASQLSNAEYSFENTSQPCRKVNLMGSTRFQKLTHEIAQAMLDDKYSLTSVRRDLSYAEDPARHGTNESIEKAKRDVAQAETRVQTLEAFSREITMHWTSANSRELGYVLYAPPLTTNTGKYGHALDIALVDLDLQKLDATTFSGNVMDLGPKIKPSHFRRIMHPNPRSAYTIEYPWQGLLALRGTIPEDEIRCPSSLDKNDDPCLVVMKNGNTTGLTFGRASSIRSCVRNLFPDEAAVFSMEWCITANYKPRGFQFSEAGDSGSIFVDGQGRIGGMITGGSGSQGGILVDITYATSIHRIMDSIKLQYPGAHLHPVLDA